MKSTYTLFNADEIGIFYKMIPDKIIKFKGVKCTESKLSKKHILSVLLKKPRCFSSIKRLLVTYKSNKSV